MVKTEEEGEAKELVAAADDTDAIVVAGGDGTVSEIITGRFRLLTAFHAGYERTIEQNLILLSFIL